MDPDRKATMNLRSIDVSEETAAMALPMGSQPCVAIDNARPGRAPFAMS